MMELCFVKEQFEALAADISCKCNYSRASRTCDSVRSRRLLTGCFSVFFSQTNENCVLKGILTFLQDYRASLNDIYFLSNFTVN